MTKMKRITFMILFLWGMSLGGALVVCIPEASANFSGEIVFNPGGGKIENSITKIKDKLVGTIIPALAVLMIVIGAGMWITGHPQGRTFLIGAIVASAIAFSADAIIGLLRSLMGGV